MGPVKWGRVFCAAVVVMALAVLPPALVEQGIFAPTAIIVATRRRDRGLPPPADFDLYSLPETALLCAREVAAVLRCAVGTVDAWRAKAGHPLRFIWVQGRVRYSVKDVKAFITLRGDRPRGPGRPRRQNPSANQEQTAN
jgi:hypothetical protein